MKICTIVIPLIPFSLYVIISSVFNFLWEISGIILFLHFMSDQQ